MTDGDVSLDRSVSIPSSEAHGFGVFGGVAHLSATPPVERHVVADFVAVFLQTLAEECLDRGADLIGHLKLHLRTDHGALRASLVDHLAGPALHNNLGEFPFAEGDLTVNAIVHGLDAENVRACVYAAARSAANGNLAVAWNSCVREREDAR
jgi:hypothetical protein